MVEGWWSTYQQDEVLTLASVSPGSGVVHQEAKMELQDVVLDKEVFHEELRTQKLKVAKLEEQNLEIPEIRQELDHGPCQGCWNLEVWNTTPEY